MVAVRYICVIADSVARRKADEVPAVPPQSPVRAQPTCTHCRQFRVNSPKYISYGLRRHISKYGISLEEGSGSGRDSRTTDGITTASPISRASPAESPESGSVKGPERIREKPPDIPLVVGVRESHGHEVTALRENRL